MEDLPVEQLIKVKSPAYTIVLRVLLIFACVLAAMSTLIIGFIGFIVFIGVAVATWFLFRRFNLEYEYSFFGGELTVDKIFSQASRKRVGVWSLEKAQLVADSTSQDAMRLERKEVPTRNFTAGTADEKKVVVYTVDGDGKEIRLIIAPNDRMRQAFGSYVPKIAYKL